MISWEYLAGFFDGEGSVVCSLNQNGMPKVQLSIAQADRPLLEKLQEQVGGSITENSSGSLSKKRVFQLQICKSSEIVGFLRGILPFCLRRREGINIALMMAEVTSSQGKTSTEQEQLLRCILFEKFKELKDGGYI